MSHILRDLFSSSASFFAFFSSLILFSSYFFARTLAAASFLRRFMDENYDGEVVGLPRHHLDQQVFNKFLARHMRDGRAAGFYNDMVFDSDADE